MWSTPSLTIHRRALTHVSQSAHNAPSVFTFAKSSNLTQLHTRSSLACHVMPCSTMQLPCSTRQRVRPVLLLFAAMTWQGTKPPDQNRANKFIKKPDDNVLNGLNFDQIEILFRSKVIDIIFMCKNVYQTDQIYINFAFSSLNNLLENVAVLDARELRAHQAHVHGHGPAPRRLHWSQRAQIHPHTVHHPPHRPALLAAHGPVSVGSLSHLHNRARRLSSSNARRSHVSCLRFDSR